MTRRWAGHEDARGPAVSYDCAPSRAEKVAGTLNWCGKQPAQGYRTWPFVIAENACDVAIQGYKPEPLPTRPWIVALKPARNDGFFWD